MLEYVVCMCYMQSHRLSTCVYKGPTHNNLIDLPSKKPSMTHNQPTLYIVYNAKSTLLGKVDYVYRKKTSSDPTSNPACAACELTHGPSLRLTESPAWTATKKRIHRVTVSQVHTDERPPALAQWMDQAGVLQPAVIAATATDDNNNHHDFWVLLTSADLARVRGDHARFLELLQSRGVEEGFREMEVE